MKEARVDIPPFLRAKVWAALLNVTVSYLFPVTFSFASFREISSPLKIFCQFQGDVQRNYDIIDKESVTPTDRQVGAASFTQIYACSSLEIYISML